MTPPPTSVAVGVDGTDESNEAVAWAADDAVTRQLPLRLVTVVEAADVLAAPIGVWAWAEHSHTVARDAGDAILESSQRIARQGRPTLAVSRNSFEGDRVAVLLSEAEVSGLLVLGSRRLGALRSAFLGSVGTSVIAATRVPVVVVHGNREVATGAPRVVVGLDGAQDSEDLLAFAFDHAVRHNCEVHALHCWHPHPFARAARQDETMKAAHVEVEAWISQTLDRWQSRYPQVKAVGNVVDDHPVVALTAAGRGAQLIVLGTRQRTNGTMGSTCVGVMHHADRPVAVLPAARP